MAGTLPRVGGRGGRLDWTALLRTPNENITLDIALIAVRIALAWVFVYYGAQKLFGAFGGPGIHGTALYFSNTAHLRPGGFFAVLGGVTEFGGGIAMALGFLSRPAALALFGDQVIAMITVTWADGFGSLGGNAGYQFNVTVAVLALVVTALGAGRLSADYAVAAHVGAGPVRPNRTATGADDPDRA
jgi:putative oxidoreductase